MIVRAVLDIKVWEVARIGFQSQVRNTIPQEIRGAEYFAALVSQSVVNS